MQEKVGLLVDYDNTILLIITQTLPKPINGMHFPEKIRSDELL